MKRCVTAAAAALAVVSLTAASVGAAAPRTRLKAYSCQHAVSPVARALSVTAVMRPVKGTQKLQMRFDLLSKPKGALGYTLVNGGDLGTWISPKDPTLGQRAADTWIVAKQVADLAAPAAYRMQVSFRWLGAHDRVLGSTQRVTPSCWQPELRPDLFVYSIIVQPRPKHPAQDRYIATIVNNGATAAGPFDVLFSPGGGQAVVTRSEPGLRAHGHLQAAFVGPACLSTSATTVSVDPAGQVDDFNRQNNQLTAVCPTPTTP